MIKTGAKQFRSKCNETRDVIIAGMNNFLSVGKKKIAEPVQGSNTRFTYGKVDSQHFKIAWQNEGGVGSAASETKMFVEKTGQMVEGHLEYETILVREVRRPVEGVCQIYKYVLRFIPHEQVEEFDGFSNVRIGTFEFEAYLGDNGTIIEKDLWI